MINLMTTNLGTFTGKDDMSMHARRMSSVFRAMGYDFTEIDQRYQEESQTGAPMAWKHFWTENINESKFFRDFNYNRVILIYIDNERLNPFILPPEMTNQTWHAAALCLRNDELIRALLVSENEQLRYLWNNHHPNGYEYSMAGFRSIQYRPWRSFASDNHVEIVEVVLKNEQDLSRLNAMVKSPTT